jgi:radical SAM protein with 4Fe4S-binding SPASM domain
MGCREKPVKSIINEFLQYLSFMSLREKSFGSPTVYNIETTNHCGMECIMCPRPRMKRKVEHMSLELFQRIVDEAKDWTEYIFLDHFGDPLLNPGIFKMISYAKSAGLHAAIETNATSLTPDMSKQLIQTELDLLVISLDGTNQETYSHYRGKNANYGLAVKNIEGHIIQKMEMNKSLPFTAVSMIEMDGTAPQVDRFVNLWSRKGIDRVWIKHFAAIGGSVNAGLSADYSKGSNEKRLARRCYFPWSSLTILVDGRVVPCCYDYDGKAVLGDLKKESLAAIWNGKPMKKLRKEHIRRDYAGNSLCENCMDRRWHRGFGFIAKRIRNILRCKNGRNRNFDPYDVGLWCA